MSKRHLKLYVRYFIQAVLGIGHKKREVSDCSFFSMRDHKCHYTRKPSFCNNCAAYQCNKICGICKHFFECNADISGEICERFEEEA